MTTHEDQAMWQDVVGEVGRDGDRSWYRRWNLHLDDDREWPTENEEGYGYAQRELHRDGDRPAIIKADGSQLWFQRGELHRDGDKPAVVDADGGQEWWQHGQWHRDGDQPAIIWADGMQEWYEHGKRHRENGPAIINANGSVEWHWEGWEVPTEYGERYAELRTSNPAAADVFHDMFLDEYAGGWYGNSVEVEKLIARASKHAELFAEFPGAADRFRARDTSWDGNPAEVFAEVYTSNPVAADLFRAMYTNGWTGTLEELAAVVDDLSPQPAQDQEWLDANGERHRDGDQPALIRADGTQEWYQHGERHRDNDQPAVVYANGWQAWYQHGEYHRDGDLPAFTGDDWQQWYQHGERHRDGDQPAYTEAETGRQEWFQHGQPHRDGDQPAVIEANGDRVWIQHGEIHRDGDLPTMIGADGEPLAAGNGYWMQYGGLQRESEIPAYVRADGDRRWWQRWKEQHRRGAAFINAAGSKAWNLDGGEVPVPAAFGESFAEMHLSHDAASRLAMELQMQRWSGTPEELVAVVSSYYPAPAVSEIAGHSVVAEVLDASRHVVPAGSPSLADAVAAAWGGTPEELAAAQAKIREELLGHKPTTERTPQVKVDW